VESVENVDLKNKKMYKNEKMPRFLEQGEEKIKFL